MNVRYFLLSLLLIGTSPAIGDDTFQCGPPIADEELRSTRRFWTKIALLDSKPMPMPRDGMDSRSERRRRFSLFRRRRAAALSSSKDPFDANYNQFPFSAVGRLSFRDAGGTKRWCSAALVDDASTVITAAHCIRDRSGKLHTKVAFVRAYEKGAGELFAIRRIANDKRWVTEPTDFRQFDYAILETQTAASTFLPIVIGDPTGTLTAVGYPVSFGNGKEMQRDSGKAGTVNTTRNTTEMLDHSMDDGSSGGPWLSDLGTGEVTGITASKLSDTVALTPRFTTSLRDLIDHVQAGCP